MYNKNYEKSIDLIIQQMDTTWRVVYMLIDQKPTAGDQWQWIGSEEKGYQVFLNRKLVSSDPQVVAKLQMIRYLDEQLKQLRIEGGESNGEV